MKILSCFSDIEEIKPLAAAGAGELYCAVAGLPSFGEPASLPDLRTFGKAARAAHRLGLKISLAVNSVVPKLTPAEEGRLLKDLGAAAGHPAACRAEIQLFEEVLQARVTRVTHIAEGDRCCTYRIEPREA